MEITEILDSYLGKQTNVALKEVPKIARELKYHFNCKCSFYKTYSDGYSHIIGYVVNEEQRTITLYSGFLSYFIHYIKDRYGYVGYRELLTLCRSGIETIVSVGNHGNSSKYKILEGYSDFIRELR